MNRPVLRLLGWAVMGITALSAEGFPQRAAETAAKKIFSNGVIRLIPELTVSDEALGGGDYFGEIVDLALDGRGCLYVCDGKAKNIKKFDAAGKLLKKIGKGGQGPGEFDYPSEVVVDRDRLIVRDVFASRISFFDLDGKFLSSIAVDRKEGSWRKIRALPDGRFIIETELVDWANLNAAQEFRLSLHAADFSHLKTLYRKPVIRNKFITEPVRTNVPFPFASRALWGLLPDGKIAVALSGTYEIEILDPDRGRLRSWTHPYTPVGVTARDKEEFFAGMTFSSTAGSGISTSKGAPDYIVKNTEFPKTKPAFERLVVDGKGRLWVFPSSSDPKAKPSVEVFDQEGVFLGRAALEGDWPPYAPAVFYPNGVWIVVTDEDGGTKIVKLRIAA
jgi:hypothetical protein